MQIARNALRDAVAVVAAHRHRRQAPRPARREGRVRFAARHVVDLKDMELQAAVPAVDVPELSIGKTVELDDRRLRRAPLLRPDRADQPVDRAGHARVPRLCRHPEPRRGAARRHVRHRPHRARGERAGADAAGDRRAHRSRAVVSCGRSRTASSSGASSSPARRDDAAGRVEIRRRCPRGRRCSPRASTT